MSTRGLMIAVAVLWTGIHLLYGNVLIVHDSWQHIFPIVYAVARNASCGSLPAWLSTIDNGSPTLIYMISFSLTQIVRIPLLYLWSCLHPGVIDAMYTYKAQIYLAYFLFAASMYGLGRLLFENRLSAVYLFTATLFAGLCLDSAHSNQVVSMLFWVPWMLIAGVLYHRNAGTTRGSWYLNAAVLFFCIQALDQYPHFIVLVTAIALVLYLSLAPKALSTVLPHLSRLWPALIVLLVTVAQLLIVKQTIADYAPSLRGDLIVDPRTFGETGFVQPTALLGSFLPLSFLAGFDALGDGMATTLQSAFGYPVGRWFIFRLDALLFYLGVVPLALATLFLADRSEQYRTLRRGWLMFAVVLLAVSLQQTRLYLLIFHIPFFNVFRSYFLYVVFVVFAILVMSGYGFDRMLSLAPDQRGRILRRALAWLGIPTIASMLAMTGMAYVSPGRTQLLATLSKSLVADVVIIVAGIAALALAARSRTATACALALLVGTVVPQVAYFAFAYRTVGVTMQHAFTEYGLDRADLAVGQDSGDPERIRRKLCTRFAQCYLSQQPTVSLNLDLQGTFLRHKDEPVFQPGLSKAVIEALTGLSHPVAWLSGGIETVENDPEIVERLNARAVDIGAALRSITYVEAKQVDSLRIPRGAHDASGRVIYVAQGADTWNATLDAGHVMLLNLAVNFSPRWQVTVNGVPAVPIRANLGNLAVPVGPGRVEVEARYVFLEGSVVLLSRVVLVLVALMAAVLLAVKALREAPRWNMKSPA